MAEVAGVDVPRPATRWALRTLYGVLIVTAVSLAVLVTGDVVYSFEDPETHDEHDHGFYGPIFDSAWVVFLPAAIVTFVSGAVAVALGWLRDSMPVKRYGVRALGVVALSAAVIVLAETLAG
jgi:hypothetical protein